jgi:hypothetical protein
MQIIQHQELGSTQASITFSSIPQTFTDLVLVHSLRTNRANTNEPIGMTFNGSTTNRTSRQLEGDAVAVFSGSSSDLRAGAATASTATGNTFGNSAIYISNYSGNAAKSCSVDGVSETNATNVSLLIQAALWNDTAAITSITLTMLAGGTLFSQYSSATLFGILKGSSGGVTVT